MRVTQNVARITEFNIINLLWGLARLVPRGRSPPAPYSSKRTTTTTMKARTHCFDHVWFENSKMKMMRLWRVSLDEMRI
ncbi:hypothetical protein AKJ16_DCAP01758 [Drosera capensis]